jgi:alpha-mannosidase
VRAYDKEIGTFQAATTKVIESGPLRARVRMRSTYGASTLTTDWILYAGSRNLEMRVELDCQRATD